MTKKMHQEHDLGRGVIYDNALKAAVTSTLFKSRVEKPKKGKGAYSRKGKKVKGHKVAPFDCLFNNVYVLNHQL